MALKRRVLSRIAVLLTMIAVVLGLLLSSAVHAGNDVRATDTIVVMNGDTLWEIAERTAGPGADVRQVVYDIRRLNELSGSMIHPGQRLVVPANATLDD